MRREEPRAPHCRAEAARLGLASLEGLGGTGSLGSFRPLVQGPGPAVSAGWECGLRAPLGCPTLT